MIRRFMPLVLCLVLGTCTLVAWSQVRGGDAARVTSAPATMGIRFTSVDIFVDPHDQPLAAYQVALKVTKGDAVIVGIEGGEHAAFKAAPFYDPAALQKQQIILAAFNTDEAGKLPHTKTRVARLHLQVRGAEVPEFNIKFETAADAGGKVLDAGVTVVQGASQ